MGIKKEKVSEDLQKWIKKGEWNKAITALDQLSKFEPQNPIHRLRKGDYCLKVGARQEAIDAYHQAASLFTDGGFIVKALAAYKMILRLDPKDSKAHERMENLHTQARETTGSQPYPVTQDLSADRQDTAPLSPMMGEGAPILQDRLETEAAPAMEGKEVKPLVEPEPEMLEEGVVGVQPIDFESVIVPMQEDLPPGERVEVVASDTAEMELTSLSGFSIDERAEPVADHSKPETEVPSISRPVVSAVEPRVTDVTPLFSSLSREEFKEVVERMIHLQYPLQYRVIQEGEKGDSVFVISQGAVKVVTRIGDREIDLADLKENDFFGEVGFLTGRPRTATVITTQDTEILELRGEDLRAIVERYPRVREVLENFHRARVKDTIAKVKSQQGIV